MKKKPCKILLLLKLAALWQKAPELRFGQLFLRVLKMEKLTEKQLFYLEDEKLEEMLDYWLRAHEVNK